MHCTEGSWLGKIENVPEKMARRALKASYNFKQTKVTRKK